MKHAQESSCTHCGSNFIDGTEVVYHSEVNGEFCSDKCATAYDEGFRSLREFHKEDFEPEEDD